MRIELARACAAPERQTRQDQPGRPELLWFKKLGSKIPCDRDDLGITTPVALDCVP